MAKSGIGNIANDKSVAVRTRGTTDTLVVEMVDSAGNIILPGSGFNIPSFDYISLGYDASSNLTSVIYRLGGQAGTAVATLTLAYDANSNLVSVTQT